MLILSWYILWIIYSVSENNKNDDDDANRMGKTYLGEIRPMFRL